MNILGLHIGHDAAACLVRDNRLVSMIEKERLSRLKHDRGYSHEAVEYVLCGMPVEQLDAVAVSINPLDANDIQAELDGNPYIHGPRDLRPFDCEQFDIWINGVKLPAYQVQHHHAHIASSYYLSGFTEAHGLSYDASYWPDNQTSGLFHCSGNRIYYRGCPYLNAGILYDQATTALFGDWTHAGKTMGLAAWGKPKSLPYSTRDINATLLLLSRVIQGFDRAEIAATAQRWLEQDLARVLRNLDKRLPIVAGGGTALNVVANRQYLQFKAAFIAPYCTDAGLAVGGALYVLHHVHGIPLERYSPAELVFLGAEHRRNSDYDLQPVVDALIDNVPIFWHQGRSEQGPRALTHRSIFGLPYLPEMKRLVSEEIKGRESFRPLAPVVKAEACGRYFDLEPTQLTEFMLVNARVLPDNLKAVTHIDGTARVQTVSKEFNPVVWELLDRLEKAGYDPVLINTSLNIAGKPICETYTDTLNLFEQQDRGLLWLDGEVRRK
jgi:carbamoyltransferase